MFDLTDRIAVVTGGANGIGRGIAESLTKAGATVMICDIDEKAGEKLAETLNGEFYKLDVTDIAAGEEVVQNILENIRKLIFSQQTQGFIQKNQLQI